jgi:Ras-related GTP-binding protein C/D
VPCEQWRVVVCGVSFQDEESYGDAVEQLHETVKRVMRINPSLHFEIFIHKLDGDRFAATDRKLGATALWVSRKLDPLLIPCCASECQREVQQRIAEELHGLSSQLSFHMTSIYDHSVFEALSRVIQKIIPQVGPNVRLGWKSCSQCWVCALQLPLENLLNTFIQKSCVEKVYLFDVISKIYIATDSNPVDERSYELCSEMIDVVFDITCIYG